MDEQDWVTFVCPNCGGEVQAPSSTRRTLLEEGCVFCGAPVTPGAFDPG